MAFPFFQQFYEKPGTHFIYSSEATWFVRRSITAGLKTEAQRCSVVTESHQPEQHRFVYLWVI